MTQPPNPLALGQTLYEILDTTVVATPKGAATATYQRIAYTSTGASAAASTVLAEPQADFLDVQACIDVHSGVQDVFVLSHEQLQRIGSNAGEPASLAWPITGAVLIAGFDPLRTDAPCLVLVGVGAAGGVTLVSFDTTTGQAAAPLALPSVAGTPVAVALLRHQLDAHVVVLAESGGQLNAYDLGSGVLGSAPVAPTVSPIVLGPVTAGAPVGLVADGLVPGTADLQGAVTYAGAGGAPQVALLGFDATSGALAVLATATPSTAFAPPEKPVFRAATADLVQAGTPQLVVGWPGSHGGVSGCAALVLYDVTADAASGAIALAQLSSYAVAGPGQQPLASIDLHLAAGLFGGDGPGSGALGVVVLGAGASMEQLVTGDASVMAALVTVDPDTKAFPALGTTGAGVPDFVAPLQTIDAQATGFFGLASDVTGQSVVLGPPTLSQTLGSRGQLLAIVQAPPFDATVAANKPSLAFGQLESKVSGYNVSSNKTWMLSTEAGASIGIAGQTLGQTVTDSYGHGFNQVDDHSITTGVQTQTTITEDDLVVLYAMSYYVWTYPVFRKAVQSGPDGSLAVIFPMAPEPQQMLLAANDPSIGYAPKWQQGLITSYLNLDMDGYGDGSTLLFQQIGASVTEDASGTTLTFDKTNMVSSNEARSTSVHNSTADSAHFSLSTTLLDYVPVNFGLNLSSTDAYSDDEVTTTSLSHTTTMSIMVSSGSVTDIGYEYVLTPYIYQHQTMGCLMVAYDVELSGKDWSNHYNMPSVVLPALYPDTSDHVQAALSRSIAFAPAPNADGTTTVTVEVLNSGLVEATDVTCDFSLGKPTWSPATSELTAPGAAVATRTVPTLAGTQRATVSADLTLTAGSFVTVSVYLAQLPSLGKMYWNVYPPSAYAAQTGAQAQAAAA